jgi:hypothetical protein
LLGSLLGAVQDRGVGLDFLQRQLGLPSLNPRQLGSDEYVQLVHYARRHHPDIMEEQVREQPWFVKAMGNPIVMGALGAIAAKMLQRREVLRTTNGCPLHRSVGCTMRASGLCLPLFPPQQYPGRSSAGRPTPNTDIITMGRTSAAGGDATRVSVMGERVQLAMLRSLAYAVGVVLRRPRCCHSTRPVELCSQEGGR